MEASRVLCVGEIAMALPSMVIDWILPSGALAEARAVRVMEVGKVPTQMA